MDSTTVQRLSAKHVLAVHKYSYYSAHCLRTVSQDEPLQPRQQPRGSNVAVSHRPNSASTASAAAASTGSALSRSDAAALRCLLFGDARKSFAASWTRQGLVFNKSSSSTTRTSSSKAKQHSNSSSCSELAYGLVQHDGGPCGPIAVVQALFLDYVLYSGESTTVTNRCNNRCSDDWMLPTRAQQQSGLIAVLSTVLWRAGSGSKCTVCLCRYGHNAIHTNMHRIQFVCVSFNGCITVQSLKAHVMLLIVLHITCFVNTS
jgi:hypothetical protein